MSGRCVSGVDEEVGDDVAVFSRSVKRKFFKFSAYRCPPGAKGASALYEYSLSDTPFYERERE